MNMVGARGGIKQGDSGEETKLGLSLNTVINFPHEIPEISKVGVKINCVCWVGVGYAQLYLY